MSHLLRAVTQGHFSHNQLGMRLICSMESLNSLFYKRTELINTASRNETGHAAERGDISLTKQ